MHRAHSENTGRTLVACGFLLPWLVGFVALVLYPFAATLYWSFCQYDMLSEPRWVGTQHYERLGKELIDGEGFGRALWNTIYYGAISVPLSIALGVALALLLSLPVRGQAIYRTLVFVPSIVPVVTCATLWVWLLDPQDGMINLGLDRAGLAKQNWFASPDEAVSVETVRTLASSNDWRTVRVFGSKDGLILMALWGVGNFVLIYLAALRDMPRDVHEAASLDGAGPMRRLIHVTLPILTPVIFFNLIMGLIQTVQAFTQIYLVSEGTGGPAESTLMISIHLFLSAFQDLEMGYTSAMAWVMLVVLCLATALLFRSTRFWVHYRGQLR